MVDRIEKHGLKVDTILVDFLENKALPGTGIAADAFWAGFSQLIHDFGPRNHALLQKIC